MPKLMEYNGGIRRDFVLGKDEVELFKQDEYARLHASTACKVRFFSDVLEMVLDKRLKTEKSNWYMRAESSIDGLSAKLIGVAASLYTLIDLGAKLLHYLKPEK